jgi:hypothetical protein
MFMRKPVEIKGIKCDKPSCDYRDDSVTTSQYKEYIDKPCPKCGSNLLTYADYKTSMILLMIFDNPITRLINIVYMGIIKLFHIKHKVYKAEMNGSGTFKVKEVNSV